MASSKSNLTTYKEIGGKTYIIAMNHVRMKEAKRHVNWLRSKGYESKILRMRTKDGAFVYSVYTRLIK